MSEKGCGSEVTFQECLDHISGLSNEDEGKLRNEMDRMWRPLEPRPFEPPAAGPVGIVHKAVEVGSPDTLCGVKRPRATSFYWKLVNCAKCRNGYKDGVR